MGITRKELDKIYKDVYSLYRRKNRDKDIRTGIDIMYQAIMNYIDGENTNDRRI
jgi:hypothetical protein